jgi:hypothetical protein
MGTQGWIVLVIAAMTAFYFAGRFRKSLAKKGSSHCGCCGGGSCGKPKAGA